MAALLADRVAVPGKEARDVDDEQDLHRLGGVEGREPQIEPAHRPVRLEPEAGYQHRAQHRDARDESDLGEPAPHPGVDRDDHRTEAESDDECGDLTPEEVERTSKRPVGYRDRGGRDHDQPDPDEGGGGKSERDVERAAERSARDASDGDGVHAGTPP